MHTEVMGTQREENQTGLEGDIGNATEWLISEITNSVSSESR